MPKRLVNALLKMPGVGRRTAIRMALYLLENRDTALYPMMLAIQDAYNSIRTCAICGLFTERAICNICSDETRNKSLLCITESFSDVLALEETKIFSGLYHVLGGVLSVGKTTPDSLRMDLLYQRVANSNFQEIILALGSTVDGQTTAYYIVDLLKPLSIKITELAHGVPLGGELNYLDSGTLGIALQARRIFNDR